MSQKSTVSTTSAPICALNIHTTNLNCILKITIDMWHQGKFTFPRWYNIKGCELRKCYFPKEVSIKGKASGYLKNWITADHLITKRSFGLDTDSAEVKNQNMINQTIIVLPKPWGCNPNTQLGQHNPWHKPRACLGVSQKCHMPLLAHCWGVRPLHSLRQLPHMPGEVGQSKLVSIAP